MATTMKRAGLKWNEFEQDQFTALLQNGTNIAYHFTLVGDLMQYVHEPYFPVRMQRKKKTVGCVVNQGKTVGDRAFFQFGIMANHVTDFLLIEAVGINIH